MQNCIHLGEVNLVNATNFGYRCFMGSYIPEVFIPEGVVGIGGSSFLNPPTACVRTIIPSTLATLGYMCFYGRVLTKYMVCKSKMPPTKDSNSSSDRYYLGDPAAIYVPDESVDTYKEESPWTYLASRIKPFSDFIVDFPDDAAELGIT